MQEDEHLFGDEGEGRSKEETGKAMASLVYGPFVGLLRLQQGPAGVLPFLFPRSVCATPRGEGDRTKQDG